MTDKLRELIDELQHAAKVLTIGDQVPHFANQYLRAATELSRLSEENERTQLQLAEAVRCLTWIAELGYEGAPDIAMRKAARESLECIATLSGGRQG